jgi:hypothetical protein
VRCHYILAWADTESVVSRGLCGSWGSAAYSQYEKHPAAVALNYFAYNFIKFHRTLRMTPAKAAGVTDRLWRMNDLVAL